MSTTSRSLSSSKAWWHRFEVETPTTLDELWAFPNKTSDPLFRGLAMADYELTSRLSRNQGHIDSEWNMTSEFSVAIRAHEQIPANNLELLAVAQHHGLPTRMMDLTSSFGVALYFATLNPKPSSPSIVWSMDPSLIAKAACKWYSATASLKRPVTTNYITFPSPPRLIKNQLVPIRQNSAIDDQIDDYMAPGEKARHPPLVVATPFVSPRIAAQDACFLLLDPRGGHLGQQLLALRHSKAIRAALISPTLHVLVRKHLRMVGITRRMLFPDIDNLAGSLLDAYASDA
jgi:hypothetical protein